MPALPRPTLRKVAGPASVIRRELVVLGTWNSKITPAGRNEWQMVVTHIANGRLQVAPLISHAAPLELAAQTFADLAEHRTWSNKVLFAISPEARSEAAALAVGTPTPAGAR